MTISSTDNRISYAGNGSTTAFSFPYLFFADDDLKVVLVVDATGVETTKTLTTHYTVAGETVAAGGTVTMGVAPASGETLVIIREEQFTQGLDLVENDPFPSDNVEQQFDILTMLSQQLNTDITRSIRLSDGDTSGLDTTMPTPAANEFIRFSTDALSLESAGLADLDTVSVPGSATDNAVTRFDGTGGSSFQNSGVLIDDNDLVTAPGGFAGAKGADIASAATLAIGTDGDYFDITGTTGVTAMTVAAGRMFVLQFDGVVTLTHGASLVLPGSADVTTAAGDRLVFYAFAANSVVLLGRPSSALYFDMADTLTTKFTTAHTSASSSSNAVTLDFTSTPKYKTTLTENITTVTISNTTDGDELQWVITGATGPFTVAGWAAAGLTIEWPGDAAPTISLSANEYAIISATRVGTILLMDSKVTFGVA